MAGPTFGAAGSQLASGTDSTAQIPVPPGVVADSVVLAFLYRGADVNPAYEAITPPAGFAPAPDNPGGPAGQQSSSHSFFCDVHWHRAAGPESGTYDFAFPSRFRVGFAVRVDGCKTSGSPFDADDGAKTTTADPASASTPAVSVTTTGADRLLVWAGWSWTTGAWAMPSGFTQNVANTPFDLITAGSKAQAGAGGSGALVGSQSSESHAAWVGALVAPDTTNTGLITGSLPALGDSLAGQLVTPGVLAGALPGLAGSLAGQLVTPGQIAGTLPALVGQLAGQLTTPGVLAGSLPGLAGALLGDLITTGQIGGQLPALAGHLTDLRPVASGSMRPAPRTGPSMTALQRAAASMRAGA